MKPGDKMNDPLDQLFNKVSRSNRVRSKRDKKGRRSLTSKINIQLFDLKTRKSRIGYCEVIGYEPEHDPYISISDYETGLVIASISKKEMQALVKQFDYHSNEDLLRFET